MFLSMCRERLFSITCLCLSLVLNCYSNVTAEVKLVKLEDWSAQVVLNPQEINIRPADSSSAAMALSWNSHNIIVSHIGSDQPIFSRALDPALDSVHSVVIGDFDGDSQIEVATLVSDFRNYDRPTEFGWHDTTEIHLIVQGISNLERVDSVTYLMELNFGLTNNRIYPFPVILASGDFNHDGSENLALSIGNLIQTGSFLIEERTTGFTTVWNAFPDRVDTTLPYPVMEIVSGNGSFSTLKTYYYRFDEIPGTDSRKSLQMNHVFKEFDNLSRFPHQGVLCKTSFLWEFSIIDFFLISGDISNESTLMDAMILKTTGISCSTWTILELFSVNDSLEMTSLWTKENIGYRDFAFIPTNPGTFFARVGETLYEFDGATGDIVDSTLEPLPSEIKGWYDLFGNGAKYLVTLNDTLVEAYGFDFVTDVSDEETSLLPEIFTLSNPFPNPFNPEVSFSVALPVKSEMSIVVYNILGEIVDEVFSGALGAGETKFSWDAGAYASGVYLIQARAGQSQTRTRKVMLLK